MNFKDLKLSTNLLKELNKYNIIKPTIVQEKTIPIALQGRDLLVQSETGSGKTLCFVLPTIEKIKNKGKIQVLVISPVRELAKQIYKVYENFSEYKKIELLLIYGGVSIDNQIRKAKKSDVVIGTPGRLLDLLNRKALDLSNCSYLVIDEADKLMEMGFKNDIEKIIQALPKKRQTIMVSATINKNVVKLMEESLNNPKKIFLENKIKDKFLKQFYVNSSSKEKIALLIHYLENEKRGLVLVFANTKRQTEFLEKTLNKNGIKTGVLNGNMTQSKREKILELFREGKINVLVATDVAARGIHINGITHVFNFDLPNDIESYTHRIGRTARNGKTGRSIIILSDRDHDKMRALLKEFKGKIKELVKPETIKKILMPTSSRQRDRYNNGNRGRSRSGSSRGYGDRSNRSGSSRGYGDRSNRSGSSRGYGDRSNRSGSSRGYGDRRKVKGRTFSGEKDRHRNRSNNNSKKRYSKRPKEY